MHAHTEEEKKEQIALYETLTEGLTYMELLCDINIRRLSSMQKTPEIETAIQDLKKSKQFTTDLYNKTKSYFLEFADIYNEPIISNVNGTGV